MVFLIIYASLSCLTHLAICRFVLRWLDVTHPALRAGVIALLAVLAFSFMGAFFLLRTTQAPWAIGLYRIAAVWQALAINLFLAAVAAWSVHGLLRTLGGPASGFRQVATVAVALAAAASAFGFWRAFHPVVTDVEIAVEGLPERWHDRTVVQLSDVHLGHFHGVSGLKRLTDRVTALAPDLVVITGDLLDGMSDGMDAFAEPLRALRAPQGVFFVTGNHEAYAGLRRCLDLLDRTDIRVLSNEVVDVGGLNLVGVSWPGVETPREIRGLETARAGGRPLVLLFHTPTDIRAPGGVDRRTATYWQPDTSFALSRDIGVVLQLSGHSHRGQIFPFGLLTRRIYDGYDYGLHREGDLTLYTSSGVGTWGPPMRTQAAPEIVRITLKSKPQRASGRVEIGG
jgi:predicted MPP superfamily phosphohydrolase